MNKSSFMMNERSLMGTPKAKDIMQPLIGRKGETYGFVVVSSGHSSNEDSGDDDEDS